MIMTNKKTHSLSRLLCLNGNSFCGLTDKFHYTTYPSPVKTPTAALPAVKPMWTLFVVAGNQNTSSHLRRKNWVSGLFKINAVEQWLSAFSPRDALLMGYRITKNRIYGIGKGVHCTTRKIRTGRLRLTPSRCILW